jgi:hypothetical protein
MTRMLRPGLVVAVLLLGACAGAAHADLVDRFAAGNERYEQGDYAGAVEQYNALLEAGVEDATLYYNLGNSYYKLQDFGRAVLFYERSLRLDPRNSDARDNLELVRSQLQDKQFVTQQNRIIRAAVWLHHNLSLRETVIYFSASWIALCVILLAIVLRRTRPVRTLYDRLSIVSPGRLIGLTMTQDLALAAAIVGFLVVTSGISATRKVETASSGSVAVVLTQEIPVYSSPSRDATLQFKIHSGTMIRVVERRTRWVRIELPGKLSGWVESETVASV